MSPGKTVPPFFPLDAPKQRGPLIAHCRRVCLALVFGVAVLAIASDPAPLAEGTTATPWGIAAILVLYVALLAMPFVPGAEIGLALMVVFGAVIALPVYIATVAALSIAFAVGRSASRRGVAETGGREGPASDGLGGLQARPRTLRWLRPLMRFRWLALIVLINTPGNSVLGGGGGIAMAAGYSRSFTYPAFLACVALAVAPVPVAVLVAEHLEISIGLDRWAPGVADASTAGAADDGS